MITQIIGLLVAELQAELDPMGAQHPKMVTVNKTRAVPVRKHAGCIMYSFFYFFYCNW